MEMEKQMFGKQMFPGPGRDQGKVGFLHPLLKQILCRDFYSGNKPFI